MDRFIKDYIIERNNNVESYDNYKKVEDVMSVEDYLKTESKRDKFGRFFISFDYIHCDECYTKYDFTFPALVNYLRMIDNNNYYETNLCVYLYDCFTENIYEKSFEIEERYRGRTYDDCLFYDSDDSEVQDIPREELDNDDELEISKYILEFFKLHNIDSNDELQTWFMKTIEDYFEYVGISIDDL